MSLNICVFCGSNPGVDPAHMALATELGQAIAARGDSLVYGGGGLGLMGAVARSAHANGASVLGVIPEFLGEAEGTLQEVDHIFVEDMHERKLTMFEKSDAFIVLPGGIGTLEEAIEVLSWIRLNLHEKPVVFLSDIGFWDGLFEALCALIPAGFVAEDFWDDLLNAASHDEAFALIKDRIANPLTRTPLSLSGDIDDIV